MQDIVEAYERYHPRLVRFCLSRTGGADDAEDIAQTAWERTLRNGAQVRSYDNWLPEIVRNLLRDRYRKRTSLRHGPGHDAIPLHLAYKAAYQDEPLDVQADKRIKVQAIYRAMERELTPEQRTVIVLTYLMGYSDIEAGELIGKTRGAIKELKRRARHNIRAYLKMKRLI